MLELPQVSEEAKDAVARRRANMAVALLRLGEPEMVWPLFKQSDDARLRTYLIHKMAAMGVDPSLIIDRFEREPDTSARRALLLGLGEYETERLPAEAIRVLVSRLLKAYADDPDAGLHSSIDWLLRRWLHRDQLRPIEAGLVGQAVGSARRWYVNSQGQTLAIVPGPVEFLMGAPDRERIGNESNDPTFERQHRRRIPRTYAISTKEVTLDQFMKFTEENPTTGYFYRSAVIPDSRGPATNVHWHEAALYCRWLSKKEGVPEDQICYKPQSAFGECDPYPDYLTRTGYRLPTNAEWEYACRAGTVTPRFYGNDFGLMSNYAFTNENSNGRVWPIGTLKPNDFGLFDVYGNAREWCQDFPGTPRRLVEVFTMESGDVVTDSGGGEHGKFRGIRGGSYGQPKYDVRSAALESQDPKVRDLSLGFRIARTLKVHPHEDPVNSPTRLASRSNLPSRNRAPDSWKTMGVVRGANLEELSDKLTYVLNLADQPLAFKAALARFRQSVTQGQELGTHGWWVLLQADGGQISPLMLRPFGSETDALESLKPFFPSQRKLRESLYQFDGVAPNFFRFADGYGFLAKHREQLEANLPVPASLSTHSPSSTT